MRREMNQQRWRRSARCADSSCVEVSSDGDEILIRDGKDVEGPVLRFSRNEWSAFRGGLTDGDFDSL